MPAYQTNPTLETVLYPGSQFAAVNNAATDTGITKTAQIAIGAIPGNSVGNFVVVNTTDQQAQGQYAPNNNDTDASYVNLLGCIVPPASALPYNASGGYLRFTFGTAPASGSLIINR